MKDDIFKVGLTLIPKVGDQLIKQLISYCGSPQAIFKERKSTLEKIPQIGKIIAASISGSDVLKRAEGIVEQADKTTTKLLFYTDKDYPNRLKSIADSPALIYYKGNADLNKDKIVALVGTRNATDYGKSITEEIVECLKPHSPMIVSGLAYGIDIFAHRAALKNELQTIGVMANGLDTVYPQRHKETAMKMLENGGLISENPFGSKPDAPKFPARNRIIAGMTDTLIVVEAAIKGGALITAEIAHSYNKDIFAVPGNINRPYSQGCNKLIQSHKAVMFTSIEEFEKELNWDAKHQEKKLKLDEIKQQLNDNELKIVDLLLEKDNLVTDEISRFSQIEIFKLSGILLNLELKNIVKVQHGGRYTLAL